MGGAMGGAGGYDPYGNAGMGAGAMGGAGFNNPYAPPTPKKHLSGPPSNKLFVGGVSRDVTTDESFLGFFQSLGGQVTECILAKDKVTGGSKGFGFVTFATKEQAAALVNRPMQLDGRTIECKFAVSTGSGGASNGAGAPASSGPTINYSNACTLYIRNLDACGGEEALMKALLDSGLSQAYKAHKVASNARGQMGFVQFQTPQYATQAIDVFKQIMPAAHIVFAKNELNSRAQGQAPTLSF